jgi:hypothetical protein
LRNDFLIREPPHKLKNFYLRRWEMMTQVLQPEAGNARMPEDSKKYEIFVNAKRKPWNEETISYSQVVDLAFPPPHKPTEIFTVQYSRGPKENPQGTLVDGQSVNVKSGMVFDVTRTDKS